MSETVSEPEVSRLSGWCITGHCLPGPDTAGCPGTFPHSGRCTHSCHNGDVPERARRQLEADLERAAARAAGRDGVVPDDDLDPGPGAAQ